MRGNTPSNVFSQREHRSACHESKILYCTLWKYTAGSGHSCEIPSSNFLEDTVRSRAHSHTEEDLDLLSNQGPFVNAAIIASSGENFSPAWILSGLERR